MAPTLTVRHSWLVLDIATNTALVVALLGLVMVISGLIGLATKRLLRISDEALHDPWWRRNDTSGLWMAVKWFKPGLILLFGGLVAAFLLDAAT